MRFAIGIAAALLAGCASQQPSLESMMTELKPVALAPAERATAERAVTASLKDPDSARFGAAVFGGVDAAGAKYACGTVNAKNSMGGYTGEQMYAVKWNGPNAQVLSIGDDYLAAHSCRRMISRPA